MTLTITLTAQNGAGVNFNAFMTSYFADFTLSGFPYILGGSSQYKGDQIVLLDDTEATPANTKAIVLDGSNFEYYFSGHTLSGTLTTVRLSTLGNSYNSDGSFDIVGDHIANVSTAVQISGLSISNALNVRGDFHNTVSALMGGGHDGGTADPTLLTVSFGPRRTTSSGRPRRIAIRAPPSATPCAATAATTCSTARRERIRPSSPAPPLPTRS
jgi:hypothetical protein